MDRSDKIVAMTLQIYRQTRLHLYPFTEQLLWFQYIRKNVKFPSTHTTNRCYRLECQSTFFHLLFFCLNDFNVFFFLFFILCSYLCLSMNHFVFYIFFCTKKTVYRQTRYHKTITIMMMKLIHFLFCSSLLIGIVAIWHHQALPMDIKELRFKGTHQRYPVQLEEVKCRQFKIMWVHVCFTKIKMEIVPFCDEENYLNLCNESLSKNAVYVYHRVMMMC